MSLNSTPRFIVLTILDGWGIAPEGPGNAIKIANTHNINKFWLSYPHCELEASGGAVGLPLGEDGNSETGHLNLGAGRIVYQSIKRIDMAISDGSFFINKVLLNSVKHVIKNQSNLHFMGLIGAGGVHSNIEHLYALIHFASQNKIKNVFLHLFTDGRDSPPMMAKTYIQGINNVINKEKTGVIASIMGRYWAMDRDQRWDRTGKAYFALTRGIGNMANNINDAVDFFYKKGITDEFIEPTIITNKSGKPITTIKDNDAVVFFNFRIDRPRQLTKAFVMDDFSKANILYDTTAYNNLFPDMQPPHAEDKHQPFDRGNKLKNLFFVTMTEYSKPITAEGAHPAFPPEIVSEPLSSVISTAGMRQLKITESEKERFVTYYFNGLREKPFPLEEKIIIPSPKVPTYDQKPEMSAREMTETLLKKLSYTEYKLVVINYPNPDMVGHTGNLGATVKAVEVVDECVGKLASFVNAYQGLMIITADHGNAEELINTKTNTVDTEHSSNNVPFIAVYHKFLGNPQTLRRGILADIATTIISALNLISPGSMTGRDLLAELTD